MSVRTDYQAALEAEATDMDRIRRGFARRVVAAVKAAPRDADGRFGVLAYVLTLRALEPILDDVSGRFPGDEQSLLLQHVLKHTGAVWQSRIAAEATSAMRRLAPDVASALEDAA